jgi:hypothetical protein
MKIAVMTLVGFILSGAAEAADLSAVAGHYRYEQYDVTLPDGRVLHFEGYRGERGVSVIDQRYPISQPSGSSIRVE